MLQPKPAFQQWLGIDHSAWATTQPGVSQMVTRCIMSRPGTSTMPLRQLILAENYGRSGFIMR